LTTEIGGATLRYPLLILKTLAWRIALVPVFLLAWAPAAFAWSWPVQGPVLQPFAYDESHPYASGGHRGIDIGADASGEQVVAPAAGTVSFAGSVPTNGECVSIQTPDGYTVTLTHLGSILVAKGASVAEGQVVGSVGPSGTAELDRPYVHLGIRTTSDPNGYLDPLGLLPAPAAQSAPAQSEPAVTQPSASGGSASAPAEPAPAAPAEPTAEPVAATRGATAGSRPSRARPRARQPRSGSRPKRSPTRPASSHATERHRIRPAQRDVPEQTSPVRRPVVEASAPSRSAGLDAGHELRVSAPVVQPRLRPHPVANPLPLALNGAAALVGLAAAFATSRRRRRPIAAAQVLRLPRSADVRRAA